MKVFKPQEAIDNAQKLFLTRYEGAEFCIAAGSIVHGTGTARSDLDLVIIYPEIETAYREFFTFEDMPVEAFVHDYETVQFFIDEDYAASHASIIDMIANGIVVPKDTGSSGKLQKYALNLLEKGPKPFDKEKQETLRYFISDLIDDLKGDRSLAEQRAILYKLYPKLGELALGNAGKFISTGKHLARNLKEFCPDIFNILEDTIKCAHNDTLDASHIQKLQDIMDNFGGLLFDGYRQSASKDKRSKPKWNE